MNKWRVLWGRRVASVGAWSWRHKSTTFQQRLQIRFMAREIVEERHRILAAAAGKQRATEIVAVFTGESAVLLEPLHAIGIEHFGPDIRVVTGGIAARKYVGEIRAVITRRHRSKGDAGFLQRSIFKGDNA